MSSHTSVKLHVECNSFYIFETSIHKKINEQMKKKPKYLLLLEYLRIISVFVCVSLTKRVKEREREREADSDC